MNMQSRIGYQETINCTKLCTIRIAFVKGWGEKYKRQVKYIYYKQSIFKQIKVLREFVFLQSETYHYE